MLGSAPLLLHCSNAAAGHARVYVAFDVIYRFLRHLGYDVRGAGQAALLRVIAVVAAAAAAGAVLLLLPPRHCLWPIPHFLLSRGLPCFQLTPMRNFSHALTS